MFSEITSPVADVLYGHGAYGKDPWGEGTVPVLRWYLHHDNVDLWAPGAADGTSKSVGRISAFGMPGSSGAAAPPKTPAGKGVQHRWLSTRSRYLSTSRGSTS